MDRSLSRDGFAAVCIHRSRRHCAWWGDDCAILQTLTVIAAAMHAAKTSNDEGRRPPQLPSLIVCPTTLVGHWLAEADKWFGGAGMRTVKYQGAVEARQAVQRTAPWGVDVLVVTSYECVRSDVAWLSKQPFLYCALDEGHIIRNGKTKVTKACKQVPRLPSLTHVQVFTTG